MNMNQPKRDHALHFQSMMQVSAFAFLLMIFSTATALSQVPGGFTYQAIISDASGEPVVESPIGMRIQILQGSASGSVEFAESHMPVTGTTGLIGIEIGSGTLISGSLTSIDWSDGPFFIQTGIDPEGGTNYSITTTTQLLSVPYALYAGTSEAVSTMKNMGIMPENLAGTVTDIQGNVYKTITIGTQTWMAENLRTILLNDGTELLMNQTDADWESAFDAAGCFYYNELPNTYVSVTCGVLYNFQAVYSHKLCPSGWHVPTYNQWGVLIEYLGGEETAGGKLKESGTTHWESPNTAAVDEINFSALPGGYRNATGAFNMIGSLGYWWTGSFDLLPEACFCGMSSGNGELYRGTMDIRSGFSVRCIKD